MPEELLAPEGSVAAFADVVDGLDSGARILDCAAGTGQLAVGLALRGFEVFEAALGGMADDALASRSPEFNPRQPSAEEIVGLYREVY